MNTFKSCLLIGTVVAATVALASANNITLSWPNPSTAYVLQQTVNMNAAGGGWTDVTPTPVVNGTKKEVSQIGRASCRERV